MRRIAATGLLILIPVLVFAANAHFISGPTISEHNGSLEVCGSIAGLGNQDVTIQVSATADVQCVNRGGNPPPGQRQTVSGSVSNLRTENGRVDFCVRTSQIENPCPDHMRPDVTFSDVKVTVIQDGRVVLQQSFQP